MLSYDAARRTLFILLPVSGRRQAQSTYALTGFPTHLEILSLLPFVRWRARTYDILLVVAGMTRSRMLPLLHRFKQSHVRAELALVRQLALEVFVFDNGCDKRNKLA
jgi:hypothetical protein